MLASLLSLSCSTSYSFEHKIFKMCHKINKSTHRCTSNFIHQRNIRYLAVTILRHDLGPRPLSCPSLVDHSKLPDNARLIPPQGIRNTAYGPRFLLVLPLALPTQSFQGEARLVSYLERWKDGVGRAGQGWFRFGPLPTWREQLPTWPGKGWVEGRGREGPYILDSLRVE